MNHLNQLIIVVSLVLGLDLAGSDKKPSVKPQETRFPGIVAGNAPAAAATTKTSLAQSKLHSVIKSARTQVRHQLDTNCSECVTLAKNKMLLESPILTYCLTCLELMSTMPEQRLAQAIERFQADSLTLHLAPATIRKACMLWHYKPQQFCYEHRGLAKEKTEKKSSS